MIFKCILPKNHKPDTVKRELICSTHIIMHIPPDQPDIAIDLPELEECQLIDISATGSRSNCTGQIKYELLAQSIEHVEDLTEKVEEQNKILERQKRELELTEKLKKKQAESQEASRLEASRLEAESNEETRLAAEKEEAALQADKDHSEIVQK